MNALAYFVHAKINGGGDESAESLSNLEKLAWKDLQALFSRSPQEMAESLALLYPSPAEWPVVNYPITSP